MERVIAIRKHTGARRVKSKYEEKKVIWRKISTSLMTTLWGVPFDVISAIAICRMQSSSILATGSSCHEIFHVSTAGYAIKQDSKLQNTKY